MLADWSNRTIQRQDKKECSALSVVVNGGADRQTVEKR